ncbi:hypothetical protein HJA83_09890 [Rhizobium bangladeshense]|uniref:hypothetical protein n=1 Tax=Rhizobium bangladeshense TaxID=1138189 RepID=UPI001C8381D8|nr:hypothetical protein [Rhizobium bangladeshense]MBX4901645.1 hypothetical protein [Rhizobium bangladeshense]
MAFIVYKGKKYSVQQSEVYAVPQGATELISNFSGTWLNFTFRSDASGEVRVDRIVDRTANSISWTLLNFNNPFGTSFDTEVGDVGGSNLRLSGMVQTINSTSVSVDEAPRLVTLTFMLEFNQ